ncbi:MFS transporter [Paractinoplanes durhamensis]|uniref:MFS transporter n=1 Tax=Paractinoplanes durhamensis TaxID=113563 RepID=A0ABQ3Z1H9_9ACTN|nr:MFS transporter [Actinoplanes durhamensis]GIE03677.1 MFS transporter [Actinoplanes durhamensis]
MEKLTAGRRWAALLALALGGFGLGLTEFAAMGLLPEVARDLLPDAYARSSSQAVATAGWVITVYALGVVVGAPTIATLTARVARRKLVLGLLVMFTVGTVASALAPTFGLILAGRFVAGLAHGAYFGAAGLLAASMLGAGNQAKGFSIVLSGLTAANVFGVPLITGLGQVAGWRAAYLAVACVFALTLLAVLAVVPEVAAAPGGSPRGELAAFRSPQVWLVALVAAVGFGGFFAVNSYIAPITTHVTGLSESAIPWVLGVMGLGMTIGNVIGGIAADRNLRRSVLFGFAAMIATTVLFGLVAGHPIGLFAAAFLIGAASLFMGPALQALLISVAPRAQLMGAAVNQSATNLANSLGAALGGVVIAAGWGYLSPAWLGVALAAGGLLLALASNRLDARQAETVETREPALVQAT